MTVTAEPLVTALLYTLPGSRTEDDIPAEALEKLKSRQHPDRD